VLCVIVHSGKYNDYLKVTGGNVGGDTCNRAAKPTDVQYINENTPLIRLISLEDTANENDWLYVVLMDVVSIPIYVVIPRVHIYYGLLVILMIIDYRNYM